MVKAAILASALALGIGSTVPAQAADQAEGIVVQRGCEVRVTGATNATWKVQWQKPTLGQPAFVGASTDYWGSESEMRAALGAIVGLGGKTSKEEKEKAVDEGMKADPRFIILSLICKDGDRNVQFLPTKGSKYKDIPFKPGTYKIGTAPGAFASWGTKVAKQGLYGKGEGTLVIKKFDLTGVAGTFSFKAKRIGGKDEWINVEGAFDFPCTGGKCKP